MYAQHGSGARWSVAPADQLEGVRQPTHARIDIADEINKLRDPVLDRGQHARG
jgi:hypothetical protein